MNIKQTNFNLLDCTLRDGGYYNNWNFSKKIIQKYINGIYTTGIRHIELGFRFYEKNQTKGLTAYTNKELINSLSIPKDIKIGVMINAGDLIQNNKLEIKILKKLINKNNFKKIDFIRLACHQNEVFLLSNCIKYLKSLKLKIFINVMQCTEINNKKLKNICEFLKKNKINIIYIADSLGCLKPKQLKKISAFFKKNWDGQIGLHAHNNLKLALRNSMIAIKNDFKWIDSTVTGMGRGPGNLKTEDIIKNTNNYFLTRKFKKTKLHFNNLKNIYKWGSNKYYKFAAQKKIHPTYIQKILADSRYSTKEYKKILLSLAKVNTKKFNAYRLFNSVYFNTKKIKGQWLPKNILKNKDILILGPGKNLKTNIKQIEKKISEKNYFVISLNTFQSINEKYIKLRAICHPFRISSEINKIKKFKSKFVIPFSSFSTNFKRSVDLKNKNFYDFGMSVKTENPLIVKNTYCILPSPLAIGYALSLVIAGQARSIKVAGFDGYEKSDPDFDITEQLIKLFVEKYFKKKIVSLTKTKFNNLNYNF